ncbi:MULTISPECIES: VanZ family protein [unclassified Nocardiopsis]|uniref:VanZ family protein n=1 Tax=Nocardiopsis TaxID=2013 RepID=UPI00387AE71C
MDLVRFLWSTQLLVNPWTIAAAVVVLALFCLLVSGGRRPARAASAAVLGVLSLGLLVVLVQPVGGWANVGQHDRYLNLVPFVTPEAETREAMESADEIGVHKYEVSDGRRVYSNSSGTFTLTQIAESRSFMVAEDALFDAYREVSAEGEVVWYGPDGEDLPADDVAYLEAEVRDGTPESTQQSLEPQQNLLNLLIFVPVGIAAVLALASWPARLLFGPLLSLAIEALQWLLATGRQADVTDLVTNSSGALLGVAFMGGALYLRARRERKSSSA